MDNKKMSLFIPNFKQNAAIFPNRKGPWPQSQKLKRDVRALKTTV